MTQSTQATCPRFAVEDHPLTPELKAEALALLSAVVANESASWAEQLSAVLPVFQENARQSEEYEGPDWIFDVLQQGMLPDGSSSLSYAVSRIPYQVFRMVAALEPYGVAPVSLALKKAMLAHGLIYSFYAGPFDDGATADEFADVAAATGYGLSKVAGIDLYSFIKDYCEKTIKTMG